MLHCLNPRFHCQSKIRYVNIIYMRPFWLPFVNGLGDKRMPKILPLGKFGEASLQYISHQRSCILAPNKYYAKIFEWTVHIYGCGQKLYWYTLLTFGHSRRGGDLIFSSTFSGQSSPMRLNYLVVDTCVVHLYNQKCTKQPGNPTVTVSRNISFLPHVNLVQSWVMLLNQDS